jgi:hypothetical protein
MIKRYHYEDISEAVQWTGKNINEIVGFVYPAKCKEALGVYFEGSSPLVISRGDGPSNNFFLQRGQYIMKINDGFKIIDEVNMDKYKKCEENDSVHNYHRIGNLGIGKVGASVSLNWNTLDRNYNGNIDLYVKEKTDEN